MEIIKKSSIIKSVEDKDLLTDYLNQVDDDLRTLFTFSQSKVRFGDGTNGSRGENISGEFRVVDDSGDADAEIEITHTLGAVPIGFIVVNIDKAGVVYSSDTAWTSTKCYLKCSVANCEIKVFLLK